jgi:ABC-type transport system substrate-binding protein
MLFAGEADIVEIPKEFAVQAEASGFELTRLEQSNTVLVAFFQTWNPDFVFSNKKVRMAFNLAVDKEAIIQNILLGFGTRGVSNVFTPVADGWIPDLHIPQNYDPERAKALLVEGLEEFGWDADETLEIPLWSFVMSGGPEVPAINLALASYWEAMGVDTDYDVKINVTPIEYTSFRPKWRYWPQQFEVPGEIATWNNSVQLSAVSRSRTSYVHYDEGGMIARVTAEHRDRVYELYKAAAEEMDEAARIEILKELNRLNVGDWVEMVIAHHDSVYAMGREVGSWEPMLSNIYTKRFESATHSE